MRNPRRSQRAPSLSSAMSLSQGVLQSSTKQLKEIERYKIASVVYSLSLVRPSRSRASSRARSRARSRTRSSQNPHNQPPAIKNKKKESATYPPTRGAKGQNLKEHRNAVVSSHCLTGLYPRAFTQQVLIDALHMRTMPPLYSSIVVASLRQKIFTCTLPET